MFDKFKNLARLLSFVFIFNFLVLNFGIKPKEASASILNISSTRIINYDLKVVNNHLVFDFSRYLNGDEKIETFELKDGNTTIKSQQLNDSKKAWKIDPYVFIDGRSYDINATAVIGGQQKKIVYKFFYHDYESFKYRPMIDFTDNNKVRIRFKDNFLDFFNPEDTVRVKTYHAPLDKTFKVKDLRQDQVFENVSRSNFGNNGGDALFFTVGDNTYKWKLYTVNKNNKLEFNLIDFEIKSGKFKDGSNAEIEAVIKNGDITLRNEERIDVQGTQATLKTATKGFIFTKQMLVDNDYNVTLTPVVGNGYRRQGIISACSIRKFQKLNFSSTFVDLQNSSNVTVDLTNLVGFLSNTDSKNKLYIYEINDNFSKGTKFGEKLSGVSKGVNSVSIGNKKFNKNKGYIVELTNGTTTIYTPFVYTPMDITSSEVKETSVKMGWTYPSGYTPASGDKIEIFLRDKQNNSSYSSIPNVALTHGSGNINLNNTTSTVVTGIAPGTNYEVKVVLNNQRGSVVSFTEFTTKPFELTKPIEIKDAFVGDDWYKIVYPRSRTINVQWDFEPSNMEFSSGDKVEIWVKPNTSSEFSGYPKTDKYYNNPAFIKTQDLSSTRSANIKIPSWMTNFHVDLIYTIGGKKVITNKPSGEQGEVAYNRRTVNAKVNKPKLEVTDITQTTAKVKWDYDKDFSNDYKKYEPETGHVVKINIKKINSLNDYTTSGYTEDNKVFFKEHGKDENGNNINILNFKEFELTGLEVGQCYRIRLQHVLQRPGDFDNNYRSVEEFYNFQTGAFTIENLKATQIDQSPKVKLTWGTSSAPMFGQGESEENNIKVYLKESTTSEYPEIPVATEIQNYSVSRTEGEQQAQPTKQCTIELPKYNTLYNVKVEYTLKGKKIEEYVLAEAKGEISVSVNDVKDQSGWQATINWTYPGGYKKRETDKIKLTVVKREDSTFRNLPNGEIIGINDDSSGNKQLTGLEANKIYDVIVAFVNNDTEVHTVRTNFKATNDLQIVGLVASDIKSKTATIKWDYVPKDKDFTDTTHKLEVYIKENPKSKNQNDLSSYKKIYTVTHKNSSFYRSQDYGIELLSDTHSEHVSKEGNLKEFKSLDLSRLGVNKDYSIKVKYTHDTDAEAEVSFKTIADTFKATVFVSNQTSASYGWEYPPGYELQYGDKVKIYVKEVDDKQKNSGIGTDYKEPLLVLEHGIEDVENGKYDLNEVTRVDVSGLTPEKKYKSKIEFLMGGDGGHTISTEVDISTKSFEIKSFEVDSYEEYDILVKWEIEPENMIFNPADKAEIFVKLASSDAYPEEPSYRLTSDGENNISNTFSDYVLAESIGVEQNMKLVYTVGDKKYEKELTFTNSIDPLKAKVFSVNETRALIEVETPSNYEFVNGDALLIYAKDEFSDGNVQSDDFLVFEGVQSDTLSIADDMKLIELSYLLPEAKYDIVVALDLEDGTVEPVKLEFTTEALPITDIKLESINFDGSTISWDYGDNEIDFYKDEQNDNFTDKLLVGVKESDGTPIPDDFNAIKEIAVEEHSGEDIANVKDAKITVEDKTKDYDVSICCDIGGLSYIKKIKLSFLSVSVDESSILSDGAKVTWKYPSNITFGDSDKTEVFVRKKDESNYPESPAFSSTGSGTTSYDLTGLEGSTEYIVKVQITKEGLQIDPVEAEFITRGSASSEVIVDEPEYEITGTAAEIAIPNAEELDIDLEQPIGLVMGDEAFTGFSIKFNESGTGFTIEPTIPKKKYENIEVEIPLKDGTTFKMSIKEFTTQPADTAQDWLSNAYWFAFERFPDEEGYNYWYAHRILPKTLNGEYFLKNLLFAEDEFTNRNLQDKELIAALYQIVVNREYDEEGLNFWVGIYNENLQNAQGDKKLAQEVLVDRMAHEPEFGKLCERVGIFWRQSDQDAAGVPS